MSSTRSRRGSRLGRPFAVLASGGVLGLAAWGCVDLAVLTAPTGYSLVVSAGDGQTGLVGWDLEQPLVLTVTNDEGGPVAGLTVELEVEGGFVTPASAVTDSAGRVSTRWRLAASAPGSQTLTARLPWAFRHPPVSVTADAIGMGQADVVVVHGALGAVKGAALSEADGTFDMAIGGAWSDTIFPVPPTDAPGRELVVFAHGNRPALLVPSWTPGQDTVHVTLEPPVTIDLLVDIRDGPFASRRDEVQAQVDTAAVVWASAGMGVAVGTVEFVDSVGVTPDRLNAVACPSTDLRDRVRVTVVAAIGIVGPVWAIGCPNGDVYLAPSTWLDPHSQYLLAHEVGHTFSLRHTEVGLMQGNPRVQDRALHDGEVFIAHFGVTSVLNTIYGSEPAAQRRDCDFEPETCLPPLFQVGG